MATIYSTLSASQQQLYRTIQSKLEAFQTEFEISRVPYDDITDIYQAVLEDHPEYFWVKGSSRGTTHTLGGRLVSVDFRPEYTEAASTGRLQNERTRFDAKVTELILLAKRHSPDVYAQILFLHDYLVTHTEYREVKPHCYDAYGCLMLGQAVCAGYAAAFHVLMNRLGVECGRMHGMSASAMTGEVTHAWNYVRLSDGYYFIDVTWDDPVVSNGSGSDILSHEYFGLNLDELWLTHRIAKGQFVPRNYGYKYNYYLYHGMYLDRYSFDAVKRIAQKQLLHGDKFFVKFATPAQLQLAKRELVDRQRVYDIPGVSSRITYGTSKSGLILHIANR